MVIDAEENPKLAISYDVRQAPTFITMHGDKLAKYVGVSEINHYIMDAKRIAENA